MRAYLTSMCTGWDVAQVREIVSETLHEIIDPIVYDEAVELIGEHKAAGRDVVIVSSSGEEVVAPDRRDARRRPRRRHPDGRRRRQVHRRDRAATPTARRRRSRSASWPRSAATTWRPATPTPTRSPTCRCSRPSGTRSRSTPTGRCARSPPSADWPHADLLQRGAAARADLRAAPRAPDRSPPRPSAPGVAAAGLVWYATRRRAPVAPDGRPGRADAPRTRRPCAAAASGVKYTYGRGTSMAVQPPASSPRTDDRVPTRRTHHATGESARDRKSSRPAFDTFRKGTPGNPTVRADGAVGTLAAPSPCPSDVLRSEQCCPSDVLRSEQCFRATSCGASADSAHIHAVDRPGRRAVITATNAVSTGSSHNAVCSEYRLAS